MTYILALIGGIFGGLWLWAKVRQFETDARLYGRWLDGEYDAE